MFVTAHTNQTPRWTIFFSFERFRVLFSDRRAQQPQTSQHPHNRTSIKSHFRFVSSGQRTGSRKDIWLLCLFVISATSSQPIAWRLYSRTSPIRPITGALFKTSPCARPHPVVYMLPRVSGEFGECPFWATSRRLRYFPLTVRTSAHLYTWICLYTRGCSFRRRLISLCASTFHRFYLRCVLLLALYLASLPLAAEVLSALTRLLRLVNGPLIDRSGN